MRRALLAIALSVTSACSLVFGLHDNLGPIDAGPDVIEADVIDAAPDVAPWNGCPADAGTHTFCELFDESPPWPADGGMPAIEGVPSLRSDAGCDTPPSCLVSDGVSGAADRAMAWPGAKRIVMELHTRCDALVTGPTPRTAWVDIGAGGSSATFGVTYNDNGTAKQAFLFWIQGSNVNALLHHPITIGQWNDLTLIVDVQGASATLLDGTKTTNATFASMNVSLTPSQVTDLTFHAGQGTGTAQTGVTVDTVLVDVQ